MSATKKTTILTNVPTRSQKTGVSPNNLSIGEYSNIKEKLVIPKPEL